MRLIDADALLEGIAELKRSPWYENYSGRFFRKEAVEIVEDLCIKKAPTVDVVSKEKYETSQEVRKILESANSVVENVLKIIRLMSLKKEMSIYVFTALL